MNNPKIKNTPLANAKKIIKNNKNLHQDYSTPSIRFLRLGSHRPITVREDITELQNWSIFVNLIQWFFIAVPVYLYTVMYDEILGACFVFVAIFVFIIGYKFTQFCKDIENHLYEYGFMLYQKGKAQEKNKL